MMETKANYVSVGAFVVLLFFSALAFVVWISKSDISESPDIYAIYFDGSVSGLQVGAKVLYRGVPVGSVRDISIDPRNVEKVLVLTDVKKDTPIKEDAVAQLEMQGVTGLSIVQIAGGTENSPLLVRQPGQKFPVIASKSSVIESLFASAPELLRRLNDMFNAENRQNISLILSNLSKLLDSAEKTAVKLSVFLDSMQKSIDLIEDDLIIAAKSFSTFSSEAAALVNENKEPLNDFLTNGLFEFTRLVAQMRNTFETINRLASGVERDPLTFFAGSTERGYNLNGNK